MALKSTVAEFWSSVLLAGTPVRRHRSDGVLDLIAPGAGERDGGLGARTGVAPR